MAGAVSRALGCICYTVYRCNLLVWAIFVGETASLEKAVFLSVPAGCLLYDVVVIQCAAVYTTGS